MEQIRHDFGEQTKEMGMDVWQSPTFITSRNKAIEMIDSNRYNLADSDFWILKNKTKSGKIAYTSLIISHNGCLKINEALPEEKKFKSKYLSDITPSPFGNGMILKYDDETLREYGEVSSANCKNEYPAAMLLKRVMDRVILKKSGLAFAGVYSEVEADDFSQAANVDVSSNKADETEEAHVQIDSTTGEVIERTAKKSEQAVVPMTDKQLNAIIKIKSNLEISDDVMKARIKSITSKDRLKDCTKQEASKIIDWLREQQASLQSIRA